MNMILTFIAALCGGGIPSLIIFFVNRKDAKQDKNSEVLKRLDALDKKVEDLASRGDERAAISARCRILRFMDEMLEGREHTKDSFDQVMSDITDYETYTSSHPDFKNNQTTATVQYITESYRRRLSKGDFLGYTHGAIV